MKKLNYYICDNYLFDIGKLGKGIRCVCMLMDPNLTVTGEDDLNYGMVWLCWVVLFSWPPLFLSLVLSISFFGLHGPPSKSMCMDLIC